MGAALALVNGFGALRQIDRRGGVQKRRGLAISAITLTAIVTVFWMAFLTTR